ncbi:hypothetical protein FB451DRAFT_1243251 [Mycena latifolia]|nr:hypothetical protein FB451DRAFT_1243251 [Mycena latifolia]
MQYVTNAEGTMIDGYRATAIRARASQLFLQLADKNMAPTTWMKGGIELHSSFSAEICDHFPEMGLCANDWKVRYMAKKMYPSWYKARYATQSIKLEVDDDESSVAQAKPIRLKRSQPDDSTSTTNKRTKLSSISPPPKQNEHDTRFSAVVDPASVQPSSEDAVAPVHANHPVPPGEDNVAVTATTPILFTIVNPLLSGPEAEPAASSSPDFVAPIATIPTVQVQAVIPPSDPAAPINSSNSVAPPGTPPPAPVKVKEKKAKGTKARPGPSRTPRNLCMIEWCKTHPNGLRSQFDSHWADIENNPDQLEGWKSASANATGSKTKAAASTLRFPPRQGGGARGSGISGGR